MSNKGYEKAYNRQSKVKIITAKISCFLHQIARKSYLNQLSQFAFLLIHLEIEKRPIMNRKMNIEEAVQFVLSPGSDSELSELSDMEDDEVDEMVQFQIQQEQTDG